MKFAQSKLNAYPNNLGLKGWVYAGKYSLERYLYILHRATGLGVLLYLLMHIFVTWYKNDPIMWDKIMGFTDNIYFQGGEYLVFFGVVYHALNGVRLIIGEFAYGLGKPARPIYPYPIAMFRQRPLTVFLLLLTAVIVIYGALDIFILH